MIEDFEETGDDALREKLSENEKIMRQMSETWEEKLQKTGARRYSGSQRPYRVVVIRVV